MEKNQHYLEISKQLVNLVGGLDNIQGTAHCATRLRIVLENNELIQLSAIENVDLVKGVFVAGDQLQIILSMIYMQCLRTLHILRICH
ncbi:MAG: PTS transporter subunit EIIB [Longicatena sp.]